MTDLEYSAQRVGYAYAEGVEVNPAPPRVRPWKIVSHARPYSHYLVQVVSSDADNYGRLGSKEPIWTQRIPTTADGPLPQREIDAARAEATRWLNSQGRNDPPIPTVTYLIVAREGASGNTATRTVLAQPADYRSAVCDPLARGNVVIEQLNGRDHKVWIDAPR